MKSIQKHIKNCVILQEEKITIDGAEGNELSNLSNNMKGIVCHYSTLLDLTKTIPNFSFVFQKEYKEKFIATSIVDILKDMSGFNIQTGISAHSYYQ